MGFLHERFLLLLAFVSFFLLKKLSFYFFGVPANFPNFKWQEMLKFANAKQVMMLFLLLLVLFPRKNLTKTPIEFLLGTFKKRLLIVPLCLLGLSWDQTIALGPLVVYVAFLLILSIFYLRYFLRKNYDQ